MILVQALAQCENTLTGLGLVREAVDDTAGAAKVLYLWLFNCCSVTVMIFCHFLVYSTGKLVISYYYNGSIVILRRQIRFLLMLIYQQCLYEVLMIDDYIFVSSKFSSF